VKCVAQQCRLQSHRFLHHNVVSFSLLGLYSFWPSCLHLQSNIIADSNRVSMAHPMWNSVSVVNCFPLCYGTYIKCLRHLLKHERLRPSHSHPCLLSHVLEYGMKWMIPREKIIHIHIRYFHWFCHTLVSLLQRLKFLRASTWTVRMILLCFLLIRLFYLRFGCVLRNSQELRRLYSVHPISMNQLFVF
jgi:hypothetical protein